jgi:O-succinylbenzoic acid--CoA ligase
MNYPIVKVYGSTETCAMITYGGSELLKQSPGSSGKTIGSSQIEILDEKHRKLEPGNRGEIVIKSDTLFEGYLNNDNETEDKIINGKYFSGDIGYFDADNNLFVVSRREDLIITGGENVSPAEIVNELNKHPSVLDSAVFGIDDVHWGQMVCAALVPSGAGPLTGEEISKFLRKKLLPFKIPKQYFFVESLPYNELGKVSITELKSILNLNG